ncbi:MAG: tryptophan synthase subunit beta, partial [Candidatus Brocadiaceae bacterium]|nr:tryptophan synthase subunit beta [Candidatus Brocadiaceae bacterium]
MGTTTLKSKVQKHEDLCKATSFPDKLGHFGRFGGKFVPETIMPALDQLEKAYLEAKNDPAFNTEL